MPARLSLSYIIRPGLSRSNAGGDGGVSALLEACLLGRLSLGWTCRTSLGPPGSRRLRQACLRVDQRSHPPTSGQLLHGWLASGRGVQWLQRRDPRVSGDDRHICAASWLQRRRYRFASCRCGATGGGFEPVLSRSRICELDIFVLVPPSPLNMRSLTPLRRLACGSVCCSRVAWQ